MVLNAVQVPMHYQKNPLASTTLIYGEEPLLNQEALDNTRHHAKKEGYNERRRIDASTNTDWQILLHEIESPSLFAPKTLIELHANNKTLDKTATAILKQIATLSLNNTRLILHLPRIEKPTAKPWFKALEKTDFLEIRSYTLKQQDFEKQIQKRLITQKLQLSIDALRRFLDYHEGNLVAAQQSINRLAYYAEHKDKLEVEDIEKSLDDFSHHSIFAFRDALLQGDWLYCYRIAKHIEESDKKLILRLNFHLARDANILLQLKGTDKSQHSAIFKQAHIIQWQQKPYLFALPKFSVKLLSSLLHLAAKIDRISKGDEPGNPWLTLQQYCLLRVTN